MKRSDKIKKVNYLQANAAEIVKNIGIQHEPLIITQNGDTKDVIQGIESYEQTQQTMTLLKILALGNKQIEEGKVQPAAEVIKQIR